jgi:hypothetical protein
MKIKHKYKVHHLLDAYPTEEDILFDICNFLQEKEKLNEEWSDSGIKSAFQKKLSEEEIETLLQSLSSMGYLSCRTGSGKRKYYKIINHDFGDSFPLESIKKK